jgi:hypothetical protein
MKENTVGKIIHVFGQEVSAFPQKPQDSRRARKESDNMKKTTNIKQTQKLYIAVASWVIVGSAIGIYVYDWWARENRKEALAPLAASRTCGPEKVLTDKELDGEAAKWLVNQTATPRDLQKVLLRNLAALPDAAVRTLLHNRIRFAVETNQAPYTCASQNTAQPPGGISCVKATPRDGLFAVLSYPQSVSPDGSAINTPPAEQLEGIVLPVSFWVLFQGVWRVENPKPPMDNEISPTNRLLTLKNYVASAYKLTSGEEDYYHKYYTASGRRSPTFLTRSLILTASNLYCSKDSYENLLSQEPDAVRRFWDVYGCVLGKPWHITEDEYKKICPEKMTESSTGAKP